MTAENRVGHAFKLSKDSDWKNFREFIEVANTHCNWIVLRNFEFLPDIFFENDKDVDVMCEDLDLFVTVMKLKKRLWGTAAYETIIDNKIVHFDVRFLGDGYYDKLWQYKMLKNKIYTLDGIPRMNDINYFYSLMYHCKVQKYTVKDEYKKRLKELAVFVGLNMYQIKDIDSNKISANFLNKFMKERHYTFCYPVDINVQNNNEFFRYLSVNIKKGVIYSIPKKTLMLGLVLKVAVKIIPRRVKVFLKKIF